MFFGLSNKNPLDLLLLCKDTFKGKKTFVTVHHKMSLLNKVPRVSWVPKYLLSEWLSVHVPFECPSAQIPWVPKCPKSPSNAQVRKCLSSALECPLSVQFPFECFQAKKVWNITKNGLFHIFVEFLKTFQNPYFYITLIVFSFLGNKMYKFYHILLARCNHSKGF